MKTTTSCPSAASAFGSEPQTSPSPPVLATGETSAVAKRIFIRSRHDDCRVADDVPDIAVHVTGGRVLLQPRTGGAELLRGDEHGRRRDETTHRDVGIVDDTPELGGIERQHLVDRKLVFAQRGLLVFVVIEV